MVATAGHGRLDEGAIRRRGNKRRRGMKGGEFLLFIKRGNAHDPDPATPIRSEFVES